ncbi:MAG: hypothetical protein IPL33_05765 [Sphingobacteriales bacterium]|nr:hypothetical protein [Sphingobacteriales bacterium]
MKKKQTDRLRTEKVKSQGPKEIFGENAQKHDKSVNSGLCFKFRPQILLNAALWQGHEQDANVNFFTKN